MTVNKFIVGTSEVKTKQVNLKFTVFRAIDNPVLCEEYANGHLKLLKEYGVTSITSNNRIWAQNPGTYIVLARDMDSNDLVGGIRIQRYSKEHPLLVQDAISENVPELDGRIEDHHEKFGSGEMCGLWNSKAVAKMGVSWMLTRASVVICSQVGVESLWGICANYTLRMFESVGYRIIRDLGDEGKFPYPTEDYISHPVWMNTTSLVTTSEEARDEILDLRKSLQQKRNFEGTDFGISTDYNLQLRNI